MGISKLNMPLYERFYTSTQLEAHRYQLLASETEREGESMGLWEISELPEGRVKLDKKKDSRLKS